MYRRLNKAVLGALIVCAPNLASAQTCINEFSWKWWSNIGYDNDITSGPEAPPVTYSHGIQNGAVTFMTNGFTPGIGPNGEGEVKFVNFQWGLFFAPAWARTWSGSIECTEPNGSGYRDAEVCNGTTMKADKGLVTYNDTVITRRTEILQLAASHEIGHIFGLGHVDETCDTFMSIPVKVGQPYDLNPTEIDWIDLNY